MEAVVIGVSGPSGAGKTTITHAIEKLVKEICPRRNVVRFDQDSYYKEECHIPRVQVQVAGKGGLVSYENWESPDALDNTRFVQEIRTTVGHAEPNTVVIVDGFLLWSASGLADIAHLMIHLDVPKPISYARRAARDPWIREHPDYYEQVVWPMYTNHGTPHVEAEDEAEGGGGRSKCVVLDAAQPLHQVQEACRKVVAELLQGEEGTGAGSVVVDDRHGHGAIAGRGQGERVDSRPHTTLAPPQKAE